MAEIAEPWSTIRGHTGGLIGTPTVVVGEEAYVGFDPEWMSERLGLEKA